ncbi:hypothetical protein COCC4DRAFT_155097 [Bipolaris maydis ATCC 48331]|uniref:Uncharacterized protein n=2 Tax=Cochliobolus heterostrophus TaxID=5016 RepID=M2V1Q8_COCH5|nr:uncharacterized protein COCC4DRAFT_155097 [Bipolaris maydis ATCC 48331]EMD93857.1 hypothetical protein COCHEDRAFT_1096361 [Bipolaris maydis C5]ENH98718.1 hypothetical protein COCC4DRAFT_155097 [Bipolaris maydis ATCC 48331]
MPGMAGLANSRRRADIDLRRPMSLPMGASRFLGACRFPSTIIYNLAAISREQSIVSPLTSSES